jgi:hypothetical protein
MERLFRDKHSSLLQKSANYRQKSFITLGPGACIIKLITAVLYDFCNKLECLSLASLSSLGQSLGTNILAHYGNRKLRPQ